MSLDEEWLNFLNNQDENIDNLNNENINDNINKQKIPDASLLNISTKTKIIYLNTSIELENIFWKIKLINYIDNNDGVIKKQIKIQTNSINDYNNVQNKIKEYDNYFVEQNVLYTTEEHSVRQDNFKDVRKINIGITKKDIISYRSKQKSAFYNCFVIILRIFFQEQFREIHVKIFNTGKMEIPGIHNDDLFEIVKNKILNILQPHFMDEINFKENSCETVLVNSNFNAGFNINRQNMYNILRNKYNISASFDPCSYPGIQCKYNISNNKNISFMIFRTGSILIVGKCSDEQLYNTYDFIKELLKDNYYDIYDSYIEEDKNENKNKVKKKKKKIIYF